MFYCFIKESPGRRPWVGAELCLSSEKLHDYNLNTAHDSLPKIPRCRLRQGRVIYFVIILFIWTVINVQLFHFVKNHKGWRSLQNIERKSYKNNNKYCKRDPRFRLKNSPVIRIAVFCLQNLICLKNYHACDLGREPRVPYVDRIDLGDYIWLSGQR